MGKKDNMIKNLNRRIRFSLIITFIYIAFFSFIQISFASTEIYFDKNINQITKGDTLLVNLKISSFDKSINTIDGTIIYDKDKLEIKNIGLDKSIISLWVKNPIFDNKTGELSFVGGVKNGFKSNGGQVLEITFFVKKEGLAKIDFNDVFSVFLNDGMGTRISPWLKPMILNIDKNSNNLSNKNSIYYIIIVLISLIFLYVLKKFFLVKNDK